MCNFRVVRIRRQHPVAEANCRVVAGESLRPGYRASARLCACQGARLGRRFACTRRASVGSMVSPPRVYGERVRGRHCAPLLQRILRARHGSRRGRRPARNAGQYRRLAPMVAASQKHPPFRQPGKLRWPSNRSRRHVPSPAFVAVAGTHQRIAELTLRRACVLVSGDQDGRFNRHEGAFQSSQKRSEGDTRIALPSHESMQLAMQGVLVLRKRIRRRIG
ncbi:hypothetical protein EMIT0111MI5_200081 [Burkholderia sp. IT-111MI5]